MSLSCIPNNPVYEGVIFCLMFGASTRALLLAKNSRSRSNLITTLYVVGQIAC